MSGKKRLEKGEGFYMGVGSGLEGFYGLYIMWRTIQTHFEEEITH
jgi:hypothetical protein